MWLDGSGGMATTTILVAKLEDLSLGEGLLEGAQERRVHGVRSAKLIERRRFSDEDPAQQTPEIPQPLCRKGAFDLLECSVRSVGEWNPRRCS